MALEVVILSRLPTIRALKNMATSDKRSFKSDAGFVMPAIFGAVGWLDLILSLLLTLYVAIISTGYCYVFIIYSLIRLGTENPRLMRDSPMHPQPESVGTVLRFFLWGSSSRSQRVRESKTPGHDTTRGRNS